jgi:hypothetical protein
VPVRVRLGFSDGPLLLDAVRNGALFVCDRVTFSASGSVAEPETLNDAPSEPFAAVGAVMIGFRLVLLTMIEKLCCTLCPFAVAPIVAGCVPAWVKFGEASTVVATLPVPDVGDWREANDGSRMADRATKSPSASEAETVADAELPSATLRSAMVASVGGRSVFAITTFVVAAATPVVGSVAPHETL